MAQLSTAVEAYQKKGRFKVEDRDSLQTIDEICSVFGTEAVHRGFLRIGATPLPLKSLQPSKFAQNLSKVVTVG